MAIHAASTAAVHAVLEIFRSVPVTLNTDGIARELGERGFPVAPPVGDVGMTTLAGDRCMGGGVWLDIVVAADTVQRFFPGSTAERRELESEQDDKREEENESLQQHEPILLVLGNALLAVVSCDARTFEMGQMLTQRNLPGSVRTRDIPIVDFGGELSKPYRVTLQGVWARLCPALHSGHYPDVAACPVWGVNETFPEILGVP